MYFFVVFVISLFVLYKSSDWVVKYSVSLSKVLKVSTFAIGFILIAVSTSLPELIVSIFASFRGETGLVMGNIFGSNLADLTFVLGIAVLLGGAFKMKKKEIKPILELLFVATIISFFVLVAGQLTIFHGIILLAVFAFFVKKLYQKGYMEIDARDKSHRHWKAVLLKVVASLALLIISGKFLVDSAVQIADFFGLSATFIGATIIALGTSFPELSVGICAIKQKRYGLAMGGIFGSLVANVTLVLGVAVLLSPVIFDLSSVINIMALLLLTSIIVWYSFITKKGIGRRTGAVLLLIYIFFIINEVMLVVFFG